MSLSSIGVCLKNRIVEPLSHLSLFVAGLSLVLMMLVITVEVFLRSIFRLSFSGTLELVGVFLVLTFFGGMPYTELMRRHVRVDILVDRFSYSAGKIITASADLVAIGIISILSWQSAVQAIFLKHEHYVSGILNVPMWPFALTTAFFLAILTLVIFVDFLIVLDELLQEKKLTWTITGFIVVLLLFISSFRPALLPIKMTAGPFGIIALIFLFALIFLRVHIAAAMAMTTLWGMAHLITPEAGLSLLGMTGQSVGTNYIWSVAPLFMLMGMFVTKGGFSADLYKTAYRILGRMPGGLASASVAACGGFAAVCGDSMSGVVTMGSIAIPHMKALKYNDKLATACIVVGGSLGVLIPPSLGFIVYGIITEESIGKLFMAGIFPGIIAVLAMILYIYIKCTRNPDWGPPGPTSSVKEKIYSLKDSWPIIFLFLMVMGGIWLGVFTPTEAGAIGAFGALLFNIIYGRFTHENFSGAIVGALQLASMVFFIFIYANGITNFFAVTKLPMTLANFVAGFMVNKYITLCLILSVYLFLGCIMNALPAVILTLPILYPTVVTLGFDPIWFGVLLVLMVEIGQFTPPIGMSVFAMSGVAPDVPMYSIFAGVVPFFFILICVIILVILFPQIALFLPNLMI